MTVRSLFVGLTGITAMGHDIDVIGNNIANVNTVGFRSGRASFDDIFNQTLFSGVGANGSAGGINPQQIGTGVKMGSVERIFTQGSTQTTGRLLDMEINGEGFFVLRDGGGQEFLTRAGNFSLDDKGYVVDPGTGYRLIGRPGDENGVIRDTEPPGTLQIDFARKSFAKVTQEVKAGGNFDARVGDPLSDKEVLPAQATTNIQGLFDDGGNPFGVINGDVIRFDMGSLYLSDPPKSVVSPLDLTKIDTGKGSGVIMTVTDTTTINDLKTAFNKFFSTAIEQIDPGAESGLEVKYDSTAGDFEFTNFGSNALTGLRVGVAPRGSLTTPPEQANRMVGDLFVNQGNPDYTKTLNVPGDSVTKTYSIRRADTTSSIDVFDSKGNARTVTLGLAANTETPAATTATLMSDMIDTDGRKLVPNGIVPPKIEYLDPVINSANNTAVFTARQISNMVATQGVFTFTDGKGNMVGLNLANGSLYVRDQANSNGTGGAGGTFISPFMPDGSVNPAFTAAGIDVTGDSFLNLYSASNPIAGLLGDQGITQSTTLEDIRSNLENRLNGAIRQVASNINSLNGNVLVGSITMSNPTDIPSISVNITEDGSFTFEAKNGSLGDTVSTNAAINTNMYTALGASMGGTGQELMGLSLDLAAKTRSVRVSTVNDGGSYNAPANDVADGKVDDDYTDGGGITGFKKDVDPFSSNLGAAGYDPNNFFQIGNTDGATSIILANIANPALGNPVSTLPLTATTGIDDSGVFLVPLSNGKIPSYSIAAVGPATKGLGTLEQNFANYQAFPAETSSFSSLFNQRGYGAADNFNGITGLDRPAGVPIGIVARSTDTSPFEINAIHKEGITRNTVNYQAVVPNDYRSTPTQNTGTMIFDSTGRFVRYGTGDSTSPTISFDPDDSDPQGGGVAPLTFKMDLSGITNFSANHTAQLQSQDGRPIGQLDNVSISTSGDILGIFTNGDTQTLGKILLATVTNQDGLLQAKDTLFTMGPNAGDRIFVDAGGEGGTISSGSLELSNVDLAQEFTNLIVAQRAYQASTRVISTGDQILTELVNLKR